MNAKPPVYIAGLGFGLCRQSLVAELLAEGGASMRALLHHAESAAQLPGIAVRFGDVREPRGIVEALQGVER